MKNQARLVKLVKIYFFICEKYDKELKYHCERFTNNDCPIFSDQEIMTIYLFCVHVEKRFIVKDMYEFIENYLADWFPNLPTYVSFTRRLNKLAPIFQELTFTMIEDNIPQEASVDISLLDSMPIITCSGKRQGKVAKELTDKSFCATKNLWYFGVKLHTLAFRNKGQLPHPESIIISKASESDLEIFKEYWSSVKNRTFFGDKIYISQAFFENMYKENNSEMLTPVKKIKGQAEVLKEFDSANNFLFSKAVSTIRQPIESFFNWLIEKTDIQRASKVRSNLGLQVHIFGKLVAAFLTFII
jgi:Transposase DDE domain